MSATPLPYTYAWTAKAGAASQILEICRLMDRRAGAVSETVEATGSLALASELATHSTLKMTKKYSRGDGLETSRKIAKASNASRPAQRP
jgi:hypothetical protein